MRLELCLILEILPAMKKLLFLLIFSVSANLVQAQYWQQKVDYKMDIDMDVDANQFSGEQELTYYNNSPQTLNKVYYHLYFNAFQPGSEMDVRSRTLPDPDKRVGDRILHLAPSEIGYHKVLSLKQNGQDLKYEVQGTILEVQLAQPIKPGKKAKFTMKFESQVPLQVRRSGRDNEEGIRFSMTQWYPKMAEYDADGWHTDPYIGREFHGVWGDYEVTIHMDSSYLMGGTGQLMNAQQVGKGYTDKKVKRPDGEKLTWKWKAENVHDFAWAADPDYTHYTTEGPNGMTLHFIYQPDSLTEDNWPKLGSYMSRAFEIQNKHFGQYQYTDYTFIQGGDGGMEYPMATLITGHRSMGSLVGVSVHEMNHSWFQGALAFDESHYYWMDEGFTVYSSNVVMAGLYGTEVDHTGSYRSYLRIAGTDEEQPLSTHADWFNTNAAYGIGAYSKGAVFLSQLKYIVGEEVFQASMLEFFDKWKFKHPEPVDLKIIFEANSGLELDWYFEQWIYTTHVIDYGISSVVRKDDKLIVKITNYGGIPMPLELRVSMKGNKEVQYYIPLDIMRGEKQFKGNLDFKVLNDWRWVDGTYTIAVELSGELESIIIDPEKELADVDRDNNSMTFE